MEYILYIIRMTVAYLLDAVMLAMLVRAICSWFISESRLYSFLCMITEPFILPIRMLFDRFEFTHRLPVDLAFFVTYLLLNIISGLLL